MDVEADREAIRALVRDQNSRSMIGRIRDLFDDIVIAQKSGISNKKIVQTLNGRGYDLPIRTFESIMYRLRKEREKNVTPGLAEPRAQTPRENPGENKSPSVSTPAMKGKITNPADLRKARQIEHNLEDYLPPD